MKETLQKTEYMLKVIFEEMPFVVAMTKAKDDSFLKVNKAFEEMTGLSGNEIIGKPMKETGIKVRPFNKGYLAQNLNENGIVKNVKVVIHGKDAKTIKGTISLCRITYNDEPCILHVMDHTIL